MYVSLQVRKDKSLQVKVVKIHPLENPEGESGEKKLEGACDSPSSDKENASQENQRKEPPPREEENRRESLSECHSVWISVLVAVVFQHGLNQELVNV